MKRKDFRKKYGHTTIQQRSTCPTHNKPMTLHQTQYGLLWVCEMKPCGMKCWDNPTSLPGTVADYKARNEAHRQFDTLWNRDGGIRRNKAYHLLAEFMKLPRKKTHIGMFSAVQCVQVLEFVKQFREGKIQVRIHR